MRVNVKSQLLSEVKTNLKAKRSTQTKIVLIKLWNTSYAQ